MSIGTGLFLSSILLSVVLLFLFTKDRWNWKRMAMWGLFAPVALLAVLGISYFAYLRWENRLTPQVVFNDISLWATPADVKFAKGEPTSMEGQDRWIYNVGIGPGGNGDAKYLIQFKGGKISFILYAADESQIIKPYLLGFTIGNSFQEIVEKLGQPTHVTRSADDLSRGFSYDKLNVFFSFRQGRVVAYGLYQPADGPLRFRNEATQSGANE